jgi:hypothetical protein
MYNLFLLQELQPSLLKLHCESKQQNQDTSTIMRKTFIWKRYKMSMLEVGAVPHS